MEKNDANDRSFVGNILPMKRLVLSTAYLPPISFFLYLYEFSHNGYNMFIEKNENFIKQTFRNRAYISDSNGIHCISVPVQTNGGNKIGIKDVLISDHGNWRHNHINAIKTAYGSSPFYEYYKDDLENVLNKPYKYLWDLNEELINTIINISHLNLSFDYTQEFEKDILDGIDFRYALNPKRNEIEDKRLFEINYYDTSKTRQPEWLDKLSVLDLLFNMGPECVLVFNSIKNKKHDFSRFVNC